jgi:hypothetical protein
VALPVREAVHVRGPRDAAREHGDDAGRLAAPLVAVAALIDRH